MKLITAIIEVIVRIINFILQKKETTAEEIEAEKRRQHELEMIQEDNELKIAIQTGDYETVARIREKRKRYHDLH